MEAATKLSEIPSVERRVMSFISFSCSGTGIIPYIPNIPNIPKAYAIPDNMTGYYYFVVPAPQLIDDKAQGFISHQWKWDYFKERSNMLVDVAELIRARFIYVDGKFEIPDLSEKPRYEVAFVVMLRDCAYGWDHRPVNFELKLPTGTVLPLIVDLSTKPRDEWVEIKIGEFDPREQVNGAIIEFSLSTPYGPWTSNEPIPTDEEMGCWPWMSGLVIKSVIIRPISDYYRSTDKPFFVTPRDLTLYEANMQEKRWHWYCILGQKSDDVPSDTFIEVVRLDGAFNLKVDGHFNTLQLGPDILYQVVFLVKLTESAPEWDACYPLILQVELPNGTKLKSHEYTPDQTWKKPDVWQELVAGQFRTNMDNKGEIQFSLTQPDGGLKEGLVIKGVLIRAVPSQ